MTARARSTRAGKPGQYQTRADRLAREELEERQAAEKYARRVAGAESPSTSVQETWLCPACRTWARPSRSADGASCDGCQRPRPLTP